MNRVSGRSRGVAHALIIGASVWFLGLSGGALAQDASAPAAAAPSAAPAEAASQSRRDRRRAPKPEPAAAPEATATTAAAPAAAMVEPEKICKNFKPLGSHMAKRVCGTPEQWAAFEKKTTDSASDDLRNVRSTGAVIATTPGPGSTP
jgi:hypothetical protein